MKKIYSLLFLALTSSLSFGQATDPFLGTGALNANGWSTHSGTAGQLTIASGSIAYAGMTSAGNKVALVAGNGEDLNLASAAAITGVAYYSAILDVPNTTGLHPTAAVGDYSIALSATAGTTGVTAFSGRIYFRTGTVANTFNIGVLNNSGGTAAPTYAPTDYAAGTPLFVVVKYDFTSNTGSLFVNPALGGAEPAATVTNATGTTLAPAQIAAVVLRQGGTAATGTGNVEYDNVRIGSTWSYVTTAVLGVKQNAIAGLNIYPNPVSNGTLFIDTNANADKKVVIYNVLGKQVLSTSTSGNSINLGNLNSGIYIVKVTEEGKTATRKLVIR